MTIFLIIVGTIVVLILLKQLLKRTQKCPHCGARNSKQFVDTNTARYFTCKSCGGGFSNFKD